jgi:hypothetical protein
MNNGASQLATAAAVLPANPSRARIPAAVQLGTAAANPIIAPKNELALLFVQVFSQGSVGSTLTPRL